MVTLLHRMKRRLIRLKQQLECLQWLTSPCLSTNVLILLYYHRTVGQVDAAKWDDVIISDVKPSKQFHLIIFILISAQDI